jgi:predicted RNase H-like HicB family nuclease
MKSDQNFTAIFEKVENGYVAFIEEIPGVNTQGDTLDEARANLTEALQMVMEVRREIAEEEMSGKDVIKEPIFFVV